MWNCLLIDKGKSRIKTQAINQLCVHFFLPNSTNELVCFWSQHLASRHKQEKTDILFDYFQFLMIFEKELLKWGFAFSWLSSINCQPVILTWVIDMIKYYFKSDVEFPINK